MFTDSSSSSSSSDDEQDIYLRRPKIYRRRERHISSLDDMDFFHRFRLRKTTVLCLLQEISSSLSFPSNRGGCIDPIQQLLLTLRFYATGNMLTAGDFIGVSKTSASRIVRRVSYAIASLRPKYIKMCEGDSEMQAEAAQFYGIARFPRTIGAIDCTLIKINSPGGEDAEIFRSRKNFFALKVQTVSGADLKIRNIVARWPGSTHDQTIFNNSKLKEEFQSGKFGRYLLVGDSGYTLQPYLMTKLGKARTEAENLYNESIIRTRNVVERKYSVWKRRFPILSSGMRVKLTTTMAIIVATAVLHNIATDISDIFPDKWSSDIQEEGPFESRTNDHGIASARQARQLIITEHFGCI